MKTKEYIEQAYNNAVERGFYECKECDTSWIDKDDLLAKSLLKQNCPACNGTGKNKNIGELLMGVVSELGEALEAHRCGRFANWENYMRDLNFQSDIVPKYERKKISFNSHIKDTFEDELADTFIRLFSLCGYLKIEPYKVPNVPKIIENTPQRLLQITHLVCNFEDDVIHSWVSESMYIILDCLEHFCNHRNIPIEKHIEAKMQYNKTRPKKHGKEY